MGRGAPLSLGKGQSDGRRVQVAATVPLAEAAAAHELGEGRHARGKIVLIH